MSTEFPCTVSSHDSVFTNLHFHMGSAQLLVLDGIALNAILKLTNHVTLGKSNTGTMDDNVNNKNVNMITGIYGGAVYVKGFVNF